MEHKYNYVILNGYDGFNAPSYNEDGYYSICMRDLWDDESVLISNCPMDYANPIVKFVCGIYNHPKVKLPLQKMWYPFFFKPKFKKHKPYCFISIGYKWPNQYYVWLKRKYPDAVFVRFIRDLVSTQQSFYNSLKDTGVFDYWVSYDENDAKKYGMLFHNEVESKIQLKEPKQLKYDVFFAGRAKKRIPQIVAVYDILEKAGLNCFFYIMSAKSEEKIERKGIKYTDKLLTYRQMLEFNMQSRCLLEINQEGAIGYTARFLEAVMYNKLLLTDNLSIMNTPFYNSNYIQCFSQIEKIDPSFVLKEKKVDYSYKNEFSPIHFLEFLDKLLV